jgi:hypothetical protein
MKPIVKTPFILFLKTSSGQISLPKLKIIPVISSQDYVKFKQ